MTAGFDTIKPSLLTEPAEILSDDLVVVSRVGDKSYRVTVDGLLAKTVQLVDGTDAFYEALDALEEGGVITIAPNTAVTLTETVVIEHSVTIRGGGKRSSFLIWEGGNEPMLLVDGIEDVDYLILEDLCLAQGEDGTGTYALEVAVGQRITLNRLMSVTYTPWSEALLGIGTLHQVYDFELHDCSFYVGQVGAESICLKLGECHTATISGTMFSGWSTAAQLGHSTANVMGIVFMGCRFEAFSAETPGYPGGPDAIGIDAQGVLSLCVVGCNWEMCGDQDVAAADQLSIRLDRVNGAFIQGYFAGDGIQTTAIKAVSDETQGVTITGCVFWRLNGYGVTSCPGAGIEIVGSNVAPDPTAGIATTAMLDTMTYATTITLDTRLNSMHKTTTVHATGDATINANGPGYASQKMSILVINDATAPKTITFGSNFRSAGTLVGTISEGALVTFESDGTSWWESGRATGL